MSDPVNKTEADGSDDLDKLLDSCLDDFNKPVPKVNTDPPPVKAAVSDAPSPPEQIDPAAWGADFKEFNDIMESFMGDSSEMNDIKDWVSELQKSAPSGDKIDLPQTFADTIRQLTEQAQNMPEQSPEDLMKLFSGMNFGDDDDSADLSQVPEIVPLMQNLMQGLMSKELLYPSLKEITDKYPDWLSQHGPSLKEEELRDFTRQYELMSKVCEEFEKEGSSEEEKQAQFQVILELMQKIQQYGNPPKDLINNSTTNMPLDEHGNFKLPGAQPQCTMM